MILYLMGVTLEQDGKKSKCDLSCSLPATFRDRHCYSLMVFRSWNLKYNALSNYYQLIEIGKWVEIYHVGCRVHYGYGIIVIF